MCRYMRTMTFYNGLIVGEPRPKSATFHHVTLYFLLCYSILALYDVILDNFTGRCFSCLVPFCCIRNLMYSENVWEKTPARCPGRNKWIFNQPSSESSKTILLFLCFMNNKVYKRPRWRHEKYWCNLQLSLGHFMLTPHIHHPNDLTSPPQSEKQRSSAMHSMPPAPPPLVRSHTHSLIYSTGGVPAPHLHKLGRRGSLSGFNWELG